MVKVVDVENHVVEEPEIAEIEQVKEVEEVPEPLMVEDKVEKQEKPKKEPPMGTCEYCNKTMLMKTLKYSHKKLCQPPAPPTPPPVEVAKPKAKAKSRAKPKAKEEVAVEVEKPVPVFKGTVDFNHAPVKTHTDIMHEAKQQRLQQRTLRVKSLISQAI